MLRATPTRRLLQTSSYFFRSSPSIFNKSAADMGDAPEPTGLIANKGIELLTFGTPNGHKVSILLEELKEAYGKDFTWQSVNIGKNTQKEPWFTKVCPNGRIPAIVDHDRNGFGVFEGSAILTYLTRFYDPDHKFTFSDPDDLSRCEQWMAWQHGGVGPMQGQANHFFRLGPERIPYPTQRYVGETERLYGILDKQLEGRDYIVGPGKGQYSIADIALFGWVNVGMFGGIDVYSWKNIKAWCARINDRPAVKKGLAIPSEPKITNDVFLKRLGEENDLKEKNDELCKLRDDAKAKYNYQYKSP